MVGVRIHEKAQESRPLHTQAVLLDFDRTYLFGILAAPNEKGVFEHAKNAQLHPGKCSPVIHSIVSNDSVSRQHSKGPYRSVRMRRLIQAFAVRICPKTRFCMARPI